MLSLKFSSKPLPFRDHSKKRSYEDEDDNENYRASKSNSSNRYRQAEEQPINYGYPSSAPPKPAKSEQPSSFLTVYSCSSGILLALERLSVEKATESSMLGSLLSSTAPRIPLSVLTCRGKHFSQRAPYPAVILIHLTKNFVVQIDPRCQRGYAELQSTLTWLLSKTKVVIVHGVNQMQTTWRKFSSGIMRFPLLDLLVLDHYLQKSSDHVKLRDDIASICENYHNGLSIAHIDWSSRVLDHELFKKEACKSLDIMKIADDINKFLYQECGRNFLVEMISATLEGHWVEPTVSSSSGNKTPGDKHPIDRLLSTPRFTSPPPRKDNPATTSNNSSSKHYINMKTPPHSSTSQHNQYCDEEKAIVDQEVTLDLPSHTITMSCPVVGLMNILPTTCFSSLQSLPEQLLAYDARDFALDLGRQPYLATKDGSRVSLTSSNDENNEVIAKSDLDEMINSLQLDFTKDGRTGIDGELHRISAFFSTTNELLGFSIRVGRHFEDAAGAIYDILTDQANIDKSILLLGYPGVGKTSLIRDMARIMAIRDAVWVIDTSNEIAGPSNVPNPCIGMARRMMIPQGQTQHEIMLQCVQNHTPRVMIVDEIAGQQEVFACGTCKTRGVRLVASAHGDLHGLVNNPQLNGLCGGLTSVTLGDSEAAHRSNFRKTKTERRHAPTFDIVIELLREDYNCIRVVSNMTEAVDCIIAGRPYAAQLRQRHVAADTRKVKVTARNIFVGHANQRDVSKSQGNTPFASRASFTGQTAPLQHIEMLD